MNPAATEVADLIDNDCDALVDEGITLNVEQMSPSIAVTDRPTDGLVKMVDPVADGTTVELRDTLGNLTLLVANLVDAMNLRVTLPSGLAVGTYDVVVTNPAGSQGFLLAAIEFTSADADSDGIPDSVEGNGSDDTDADSTPDSLDLDSDNDGVLDENEYCIVNLTPFDSDGDGVLDFRDPDSSPACPTP